MMNKGIQACVLHNDTQAAEFVTYLMEVCYNATMAKVSENKKIEDADISLFLDCPRCFYLAKHYNVSRPSECLMLDSPLKSLRVTKKSIKLGMEKSLKAGPPLPSRHCSFCTYRQRVKETGMENDLSG